MTRISNPSSTTRKPRPGKAIDARQRDAAAKLAAVRRAVNTVGRTGTPVTRSDIARLAGVSRSFTYQNQTANTVISSAQARSRTRQAGRVQAVTAQQEASWRERALNAEDQIRSLGHELGKHRQLVADLIGQLRDPDGTWLEHDRDRLREENERLLTQRSQLLAEHGEHHRKLAGARANVSRLTSTRVKELFPAGPGPDTARYARRPAPTDI
jgi:small-conductance mechanosensitive channel